MIIFTGFLLWIFLQRAVRMIYTFTDLNLKTNVRFRDYPGLVRFVVGPLIDPDPSSGLGLGTYGWPFSNAINSLNVRSWSSRSTVAPRWAPNLSGNWPLKRSGKPRRKSWRGREQNLLRLKRLCSIKTPKTCICSFGKQKLHFYFLFSGKYKHKDKVLKTKFTV